MPDDAADLQHLIDRYRSVGIDRRTVLKMAGAVAASGVPASSLGHSAVMAQDAALGPDDVFYSYEMASDPQSFDFNLNLYCGGQAETFAGLLTFDADLNAVAEWAESWFANEDASVWTFNLRKDNTGWSDGRPVTAQDFVWSWARQLAPENGAAYAGFLFDIRNAERFNTSTPNEDGSHTDAEGNPVSADDLGLKAVDDWTLEVACEGPRAYLPQVFAYQAAVPAPRWAIEEHGVDVWASGDVPLVSNGPFVLDNWEHDVVIECSPNSNYWNRDAIRIKKLVVPMIPMGTEVLAFEQGKGVQRLDWVEIAADNLERYSSDPNLAELTRKYVYPGIWMLVPSNGIAPFTNDEVGLKVRQALTHAIDRDRLATLTGSAVIPAYCMVPIGVYGFLDDAEFAENLKFDKDLALEQLVGTPFEGGQGWPEITMHMRGEEDVYNSGLMANDIIAQLKETLGMDIKIQVWPEKSWRPELFKNEWQLVWIRWWSDYPDPNNSYGDMYYSNKSSGKRQSWSNEEFDSLVDQGKSVADPVARLDVYRQAERVIQGDVGYIPVVYRQDTYAFKPWVKDVAVNKQGFSVPMGNMYSRMATVVKIEGRPEE